MTRKIKKGNHREQFKLMNWLKLITYKKTSFKARVTFDKSCMYPIGSNEDDRDLNKLFGLSNKLMPVRNSKGKLIPGHHYSSIRVAWIPDTETGRINLFYYTRFEEFIESRYLCSVYPGHEYTIKIVWNGKIWGIEVEGKGITMFATGDVDHGHVIVVGKAAHTPPSTYGYRLGFYFGGNNTSPNDMNIKFEEI